MDGKVGHLSNFFFCTLNKNGPSGSGSILRRSFLFILHIELFLFKKKNSRN